MGDITILRETLLGADWKTIFEKLRSTHRVSILLRQLKGKLRVNNTDLDTFIADCGYKVKKQVVVKSNNTVEIN